MQSLLRGGGHDGADGLGERITGVDGGGGDGSGELCGGGDGLGGGGGGLVAGGDELGGGGGGLLELPPHDMPPTGHWFQKQQSQSEQ
jgi:hypothetical protein|mmetsp:Transcript_61076/g.167548  ORF Transcript_61076/g.167548 Transcript_61076/m.167548 type:complete len:87 (-) Transcript_61076:217-477(-)